MGKLPSFLVSAQVPNYYYNLVQKGREGGVFIKITRIKTPKIVVFRQERLEKRLMRNAWHSATTHSADPSIKLGSN